jgi:hypothetical protein
VDLFALEHPDMFKANRALTDGIEINEILMELDIRSLVLEGYFPAIVMHEVPAVFVSVLLVLSL